MSMRDIVGRSGKVYQLDEALGRRVSERIFFWIKRHGTVSHISYASVSSRIYIQWDNGCGSGWITLHGSEWWDILFP